MTEEKPDIIRKNFRSRDVRRAVFSFFKKKIIRLIPWLIGALVIFWVAGAFFVRPVAKTAISKFCNGAVYIKSGRFKGVTGIQLKGVVIAEDAKTLTNAPVFRFDKIDVTFDPWKLLRGKLQVSSLSLRNFLFIADYDAIANCWNFQDLLPKKPSDDRMRIPFVTIQGGTLQVRRSDAEGEHPVVTIGVNGQIAVKTADRQYSFTLESDGRFGFGGSRIQGLLKVGQGANKSQLAIQGRLQMPNTGVFDNSWDLGDIQLDCEFDQRQVVLRRCGFLMGPGQFDVQGTIQKNADSRRELNLDINVHHFNFSDCYQKDAIVYSEPVLELLDARLRGFLMRYHPTGMGDVQLSIQGPLDDLSATRVNGAFICRDVSVLDDKFPYRLEHIRGEIELSGRNLTLNQLTAGHHDVDLQINGSIRNLGPDASIDFRTTSGNMEFNEDLYKALNQPLKKVWYSFTPKGRTAIDYHFQRFEDGSKDLTLTLELKNAGLVYEHFPYPLEKMTGRVVMKPDSVELQEIVSHYDDNRVVTLNGQVLEIKSSQPKFRIHVQAEQIPVDDLLINAMPASQRNLFDELELEAVADMDVDIFPNAVGKRFLDYIAKIRVDGKHLKYAGFPLPMEDVHLMADVTHDVVRLHYFDGMTAGGQVVMSGVLMPKGVQAERPGMCLELGLDNFDFNDTFWNAAGQDAERILGKLRIQGKMNVSGHLAMNLPADSCVPTDLVIRCSDNPVLWDGSLMGRALGKLHLKGDVVRFEGFQFKGGRLELIPEELLEGWLKEMYSGIQPQGEVHFRIDEGMLRMGQDGPDRIDVEGGISLKNVDAGHEKFINGLAGEIDGHLQFDRTKKTWQALASCDIHHFNYRHWLISDFRGDFAYDPNTRHWEATDVVADLYDGKVNGGIEVDLSREDEIAYKLGFRLVEVSVPKLLAADGQDALDRVSQGLAYGALSLEGDLKSPSQSRGKVTAHVVNMKLGKQSVLGKILTAMQFKQPDEYVFNEVEAEALIRESQLIIENLRMVGKPLVFRGKGKVDLKQKQIEMNLVAYDRLMGTEDTILDLLARGIGSAVWKVEVRGDMNNPKVDAVFLSVLKKPLELFKKTE